MVSYTIILVYHYCTLLSRPRILPDVLSPHRRSRSSLFSLVLFPAWHLPQKPTKINENWKSFGNVQKMQKGTFSRKKKTEWRCFSNTVDFSSERHEQPESQFPFSNAFGLKGSASSCKPGTDALRPSKLMKIMEYHGKSWKII